MKGIKLTENFQADLVLDQATVESLTESAKSDKKVKSILTMVEAIHSGLTKNKTFYSSEELEKAVGTWLAPYPKPILKNHNVYEGEPLGRVKKAEFGPSQKMLGSQTIMLGLNISDPDAIEKVADGRYSTLSIGCTAGSLVCSVCNRDIVKSTEGFCGHWKGRKYDGKECTWSVGDIEFDEISFVNVPADSGAQVLVIDATPEGAEEAAPEDMITEMEAQSSDIVSQIEKLVEHVTEPQEEEVTEEEPVVEEVVEETPEEIEEVEETIIVEEIEVIEEVVNPLQEEVDALKAQIQDGLTRCAGWEIVVQKLEKDILNLHQELEESQAQNLLLEEESAALLKQNIDLASYVHKTLAEKVVDMQIILGQIESDRREEELNKTIKANKLSELIAKVDVLRNERPTRQVQFVNNPGSGVPSAGDVQEGLTSGQSPTLKDVEEAFMKVYFSPRDN